MFGKRGRIAGARDDYQTDSLRPTQLRAHAVHVHDKHGRIKPPKCGVCKIIMRIVRREAHPARGPRFELQTFNCRTCGHVDYATVVSLGGS